MFAAAAGIGLWSLVAAWMLRTHRVRPGNVWGWSTLGNALQGVGLVLFSLGMLMSARAGSFGNVELGVFRYGPAFLVLAGVALRMRARRKMDEDVQGPETAKNGRI